MVSNDSSKRRFIVGAAIEFIGIVTIAAAVGAGWGGKVSIVLGGAAIAVGVALQISAFLKARR